MGQDPSRGGPKVTDTQDPERIKEQIEATREELGDTVEALAAKTNVKTRFKRKIGETKASVADRKEKLLGRAEQASPDTAVSAASGVSRMAQQNPLSVVAAGAFALGFLAGRFARD
jgi:Protein of unknown function (DUF3618)